ncbi:SDR family oxidoreductase [Methylobacterium sp. CB376]|nr:MULTISPECIES: SDR family oxidoreductase [Methylobacterium]WFT83679.1 SDR family oxidoreductase [Methylobacterium nodulans]
MGVHFAGKCSSRPEEIAAAIEFLLSEDAGFTTGQTLFVDDGGSIGKGMA